MSIKWELVNLNTWKLDAKGFTAVIVRDRDTGAYRPYIRKFASAQYTTIQTLEPSHQITTAMRRCKRWLGKVKVTL